MDCREIKQQWLRLPLSGQSTPRADAAEQNGESELKLISEHLAECKSCREEYAAEQQWNHLISRVMLDVELPAGLKQRIQESLANAVDDDARIIEPARIKESSPVPGSKQQLRDAAFSRRRLLRWGTLAATGLFAAGGILWRLSESWTDQGLVLTDLAQRLTDPDFDWESLPDFQGASAPLPSPKDIALPSSVRQSQPQGLPLGGQQIAAVYTFLPASGAAKPETRIILTVIDLQQTPVRTPPAAHSFSEAEFLYYHDRAVKIWGSSSTAFCCFATVPGTVYLEGLLPRETIA